MRILITGGAGFIGSHLADRLLTLGHEVIVLDDLSTGKWENIPQGAIFIQDDILTANLEAYLKEYKPDVIFHLAAQKNLRFALEDPITDAQINVIGGLRILQAARNANIKPRFIFSSSAAVYGDNTLFPEEDQAPTPTNPYGVTKLALEHYLNFHKSLSGLPVTIFRFANVYGPRQDPRGEAGVICLLLNCALKGEEFIIYGDGKQTRDYTFIDDIIKGLIAGMDQEGIFNLGTGRETSILDLINLIETIHGRPLNYRHGPKVAGDVDRFVYSGKKAQEQLQWKAENPLEQGLVQTYTWLKKLS